MNRLRVGLVGVMGVILALWAGAIFDRTLWSLLASAIVPALVAAIVVRERWFARLGATILAVVATTWAVAAIEGGGIDDVGVAMTSGVRRLLSTEWPSPVRPDLVATISLLLGVTTAVAAVLASGRRAHLAPVAPMVIGAVGVIALSAPHGVAVLGPIALASVITAFAALGPDGPLGDRLRLLRGEPRLLGICLVIAAAAAGASLVLSLPDRADPRDTPEPDRTAALLDPIEATLALQQIDPPIDLHRISADERPIPTRWRTAALADYNGRRWTPDLAVRPIGRRLAPDPTDGQAIEATISFLDDDLQLVPLPGHPITVDATIETDDARTIVRLVERPDGDERVVVTARVEPASEFELDEPIGSRAVDDTVSGLADLADELGRTAEGDQTGSTVLEQLRQIETTMRNEFVLDPDAPGGGLQRALIERFLRETRQGNEEQFATAFVLLARSIGADARVATGFEVAPERVDPGGVTLASEDAAIWPEVRSGSEWLAFDPTPDVPLADATPDPAEPAAQSPAAPQPPVPPPPDDIDEPLPLDEDGDQTVDGGVSGVVAIAVQVAAIAGLVLLPILALVALVLGAKWRRRRRRLRGAPVTRIRGAWQEATDHLVDAGLEIEPAMTNDEIAGAGSPIAPSATRELSRLARLSTAATFGEPARPDLLADDAATCLTVVEDSVDQGRPLRTRIRRRLSLRSLRPTTRSPV